MQGDAILTARYAWRIGQCDGPGLILGGLYPSMARRCRSSSLSDSEGAKESQTSANENEDRAKQVGIEVAETCRCRPGIDATREVRDVPI